MKKRIKKVIYEGEIWLSDKIKFNFWYPEERYEGLDLEMKERIRDKDEFWFGDNGIEEISLYTWDGKFIFHFKKDAIEGLCIPSGKVISWNFCISELNQ